MPSFHLINNDFDFLENVAAVVLFNQNIHKMMTWTQCDSWYAVSFYLTVPYIYTVTPLKILCVVLCYVLCSVLVQIYEACAVTAKNSIAKQAHSFPDGCLLSLIYNNPETWHRERCLQIIILIQRSITEWRHVIQRFCSLIIYEVQIHQMDWKGDDCQQSTFNTPHVFISYPSKQLEQDREAEKKTTKWSIQRKQLQHCPPPPPPDEEIELYVIYM